MKTIKTIIIDDELDASKELNAFFFNFIEFEIIDKTHNRIDINGDFHFVNT
jgi:hypothetical protein